MNLKDEQMNEIFHQTHPPNTSQSHRNNQNLHGQNRDPTLTVHNENNYSFARSCVIVIVLFFIALCLVFTKPSSFKSDAEQLPVPAPTKGANLIRRTPRASSPVSHSNYFQPARPTEKTPRKESTFAVPSHFSDVANNVVTSTIATTSAATENLSTNGPVEISSHQPTVLSPTSSRVVSLSDFKTMPRMTLFSGYGSGELIEYPQTTSKEPVIMFSGERGVRRVRQKREISNNNPQPNAFKDVSHDSEQTATEGPSVLVVLLHGAGGSAKGFYDVVARFQKNETIRNEVLFMIPNSPKQKTTLGGGWRKGNNPAWYEIDKPSMTLQYDSLDGYDSQRFDDRGILTSASYVYTLAGHIAYKNNIPLERIVFGGVSQGGAVAMAAGLTSPYTPMGVFQVVSYFPAGKMLLETAKRNASLDGLIRKNTPFRLYSGKDEYLFSHTWPQFTGKCLAQFNITNFEERVYSNVSHFFGDSMVDDVVRWLINMI